MSGWDQAPHLAAANTHAGWASLLNNDPKVMWGLIADIVKAAKASEGERRTGRRPAASVGSIDELYAVLFPPTFDSKPFPEALREAMGNSSQSAFARKIGFNQSIVSRLLSGEHHPTCELIERLAHALKVQPTYFAEYRALKLAAVFTDVLTRHPQVSADIVRTLTVIEGRSA